MIRRTGLFLVAVLVTATAAATFASPVVLVTAFVVARIDGL